MADEAVTNTSPVIILAKAGWIQLLQITAERIVVPLAYSIDPGEAAVLTWALAHPGVEAILDDLPARRCARSLGLRFRGTLGLILDAKRIGTIAAARPVIEAARDAGLYLSDSVVAEALTRVAE
jgi:predicted nucleic acid-binding protein